jgi:DNA invertase Pin-like site-specific DNA recombinase
MTRPLGYSYARFSSKKQGKGSSLHRQTQDTVAGESPESWCGRNKVTLDASLTFRDLGRSAFRGEKQEALKAFVEMVRTGRVRRGSFLLVEKVDRITRKGLDEGSDLLKTILRAGISIVTLSNGRVYGPEAVKGLMKGWLELEMYLEHAHEYSKTLSDRVRAAWEYKRKRLREKGTLVSAKMPPWLAAAGEGDGRHAVLVPEKAAIVRRVFDMAIAGLGITRITRTLIDEKVPTLTGGARWCRVTVRRLLTDRAVLGEYQPTAGGKADGTVVADYYPPVVSAATFHQAKSCVGGRKLRRAARGTQVNHLFSGLIKDAADPDGANYVAAGRVTRAREQVGGRRLRVGEMHSYHVLMSSNEGRRKGQKAASIPLADFEAAVLSLLAEVDPRELLPPTGEADEVLTLSGELAALEARVGELEAELAGDGDVPALARVLRQLEARRKDVAGRLAEARLRAASPASEAWGEAKSLLDVLAGAADPAEARLRLRAVLRRVIDVMYLVVVPRGRDRLACLQINYNGGRCRVYLVYSRPTRSNGKGTKPGGWRAASLPQELMDETIDLRRQEDVAALEEALLGIDLDQLRAALVSQPACVWYDRDGTA